MSVNCVSGFRAMCLICTVGGLRGGFAHGHLGAHPQILAACRGFIPCVVNSARMATGSHIEGLSSVRRGIFRSNVFGKPFTDKIQQFKIQ